MVGVSENSTKVYNGNIQKNVSRREFFLGDGKQQKLYPMSNRAKK